MTSYLEGSPMGGFFLVCKESLAFSVLLKSSPAGMRPVYFRNVLCLVHQYKY